MQEPNSVVVAAECKENPPFSSMLPPAQTSFDDGMPKVEQDWIPALTADPNPDEGAAVNEAADTTSIGDGRVDSDDLASELTNPAANPADAHVDAGANEDDPNETLESAGVESTSIATKNNRKVSLLPYRK